MSNNLQKINNPLQRSIAGAFTVFSLLIMIFALLIGISGLKKNEDSHKIGVYGSLLGAIAGAIIGGMTAQKSSKKSQQQVDNKKEQAWKDWRDFVVDKKVTESVEITSFYLKPQDDGELAEFKPGQFLTIKLDVPHHTRPVIRTYSVSDYNQNHDYYRLSIKKEDAPRDLDVPPGVASTFMHDKIEEGSIIAVKPPNGKFVIDVESSTPAVLISNGVGITPMIAMAKACTKLNSNRHIWFLHGARNGDYHAFDEAIKNLAKEYSNLHIHYKYSRPRLEDEGKYHSKGYVDKELLEQEIIPEIEKIYGNSDAEYFLCGSPKFMDSLRSGLKELGVAEEKVFFESFSSGKTKGKDESTANNNSTIESSEITFAASNKTLTWQKGDGTILEFAENNGIDPAFSCRQGICLTCMCELKEGDVEYIESPTNEPDAGNVLICISQPKTKKLVLDL